MGEEIIKIGNKIVGIDEKITPENEEYVYAYLMEVLTGGLYPNKFDVIREYVQNGYDAIIEWNKQSGYVDDENPILIDIDKPSITIHDRGTGMSLEKINQYRYIGYSQKEMGKTVGFQGIGKLAGITAANKLIVTTSPFGINEKYRLVFDAAKMLERIRDSREDRENITIKKIISDYTDISTEDEDKDEHYTFVELYHIKEDSYSLFNKTNMIDYLGRTVSVPFNPHFKYANEIEEKLRKYVNDYDWIKLLVDGGQVFKQYINDIKPPEFLPVFGEKGIVAYTWYCQNIVGEALKPRNEAGIVYRCKNFRVGDHYLPRNTIWKTSDHLAFHFFGEIHVCDTNVLPTAGRDDFKQNKARKILYEKCGLISQSLNQAARAESAQRKAYDYIEKGDELIKEIENEIENEKIPKELVDKRISELFRASEDIKKRIKKIPPKDESAKIKGRDVILKSEKLLKEIKKPTTYNDKKRTYEITEKLSLSSESSELYNIIVRTLKDFFIEDVESFERVLKKIHSTLEREFKKE